MARRRPSDDQLGLDFESALKERFVLLVGAWNATGASHQVQAITRYVHNLTKDTDRPLTQTLDEIAAEFPSGRRDSQGDPIPTHTNTVRRWLRAAEELGLLVIEEQVGRGGQRANAVAIDWPSVRSLACDRPTKTVGRPTKLVERPTKRVRPLRNTSCSSSRSPSPPPTPPEARHADNCEDDPDWVVVEGEVFDCGVNRAAAAVAAARRRGATPAAVRGLLAWWREHRGAFEQPEAVLYRRLQRFDAARPAGDGWPAFRRGYRSPEQLARESQRSVHRRLERRDADEGRAATRAAAEAWAALSEADRVELLTAWRPEWRQMRRPSSAAMFCFLLPEEVAT